MNDCAVLETSQSHFVAPLYGAMFSTTVIAVSMLFFSTGAWRLPPSGRCLWRLPSSRWRPACRKGFPAKRRRQRLPARTAFRSASKRCPTCAPTMPKALILPGWNRKIRAVESRLIKSELGTAVFVVSARTCPAAGNCHYRPHGRNAAGQGRIGRSDLLHVSAGGLPPVRSFGGTRKTSPPSSARTATSSG